MGRSPLGWGGVYTTRELTLAVRDLDSFIKWSLPPLTTLRSGGAVIKFQEIKTSTLTCGDMGLVTVSIKVHVSGTHTTHCIYLISTNIILCSMHTCMSSLM